MCYYVSVVHVKDKQISTVITCFIYDYCYFMASLIHAYNKLIWLLKHLRVTHNNNWMINALCMLMEDLLAVYVGCAEKVYWYFKVQASSHIIM